MRNILIRHALVKEASEALKASESRVAELQEEVMALKKACDTDIQQAVRQAVSQYEQRLFTKQSRAQEHYSAISELQGQMQVLQVSLASQRDLPSVGVTQEGMNLRDEVFNYVPGTVNTNRGAAVYESPDQAFSFQKHVWFRDRPNQPDLETDVAGSGTPTQPPTLPPTQLPPHSSTPFCGASQVPLNHTSRCKWYSTNQSWCPRRGHYSSWSFGCSCGPSVEGVPSNAGAQDHQVACSGYSADARISILVLVQVDILVNIQDRELDNKAAIQLIKEQTLDNARREVEFQLDLCGGEHNVLEPAKTLEHRLSRMRRRSQSFSRVL